MSTRNWVKFIVLGALWGSVFLWIKTAQQELNTLTIVAFRVSFALVGYVILFILLKRKLPLRQYWKTFLILSLFNITIPFIVISWSQQYVSSGMSSVLNSTSTLITFTLAHWLIPEERLTSAKALGVVVGFGGVIILMSEQLAGGQEKILAGQIGMLAGATCYALGSVYARGKAHHIPSEMIAMGQSFFGALVMIPMAATIEAPFQFPRLPITWLAVIALGILSTCFSHLLFFSLLKSIGTRAQMVTYVMVFFAVALGIIFLGETLNWQFFAGGALVLAGILIVNNPFGEKQNAREHVV